MPIVKVIEVIASSEKSFDDAVKNCIDEVAKTIHNIDSVYVKDFKVHVKDGKPHSYGVISKVSFRGCKQVICVQNPAWDKQFSSF